jgi:hypothetical protein
MCIEEGGNGERPVQDQEWVSIIRNNAKAMRVMAQDAAKVSKIKEIAVAMRIRMFGMSEGLTMAADMLGYAINPKTLDPVLLDTENFAVAFRSFLTIAEAAKETIDGGETAALKRQIQQLEDVINSYQKSFGEQRTPGGRDEGSV